MNWVIPLSNINIANDGTLSVRPQGAPATVLEEVGNLKLVNPNVRDMERGSDGLFRLKSGELAEVDLQVNIRTGVLEGSNVNPVEEMVNMAAVAVIDAQEREKRKKAKKKPVKRKTTRRKSKLK